VTRVLYPGSFDPIHNGHLEIIETAARLFDHVVVAAMRNPQKGEPLFTLDEREQMLEESVAHLDNVTVTMFASLVVGLFAGGRHLTAFVIRTPVNESLSSAECDTGAFENPSSNRLRYKRMPAKSPVNGRPLALAPCRPGARPTISSAGASSPKAATGAL